MNGKLIFVIGVQIVLVYGQPIFNPMAGHVGGHVGAPVAGPFGLPIDTLGAASGYAGGGAGFPLLSPLELNAIMEAQARGGGGFKAAFTPDTEPQGYAGFGNAGGNNGFMPNFEEGFNNDGNSEFYEAPHHGEPFPAHEADADAKRPEPKGRDNRGPYHKDAGAEEGPSSDGPQEPREGERGRGGESEPSNGHPRQRGGYRDEDRESGEPNYQNEPASGGAYREHRGEGGSSNGGGSSSGPSEGAEGPEGPDGPGGPEPYAGGPGGDNYRDDGPPEHFRDHASAFQEDRDYGGPSDSGSAYEPKSEGPESRPSGKQATSGGYTSGNRRPVMSGDTAGGYSPTVYQDDARSGGAYRPQPNAGYFPGRTDGSAAFAPQGYPASAMAGARVNQPDYSGYKVITA